jgi:hypothetical protein
MTKSEKFFSFKTTSGALRLLVLFVVLIVLFSVVAQLLTTNGYKIEVSDIVINVRGADLHFEMYAPSNADNNSNYPCIILTHGGSEPLSADSLMAWEFARRGFVVLNVSAYGAGMSDQANITEDGYTENNFWRGGAMGIGDVYNYALGMDIVDPTRICAWGHSTGMFLIGSALKWSGQYLTLNDRLINVMHDELGVEFKEEEIYQDADDLAKAKLSEKDYGYYLARKAEEEVTVSHYLKAVRIIDIPFLYFNIKQNVGGYQVLRDPQCNLIIGLGTHELQGVNADTSPDGKNVGTVLTWTNMFNQKPFATEQTGAYYAGNTAGYKTMFRTTSTVQRNSWYAIGDYPKDPTAESTLLGEAWTVNSDNNIALQKAIDEGRARLFMSPVTMHNGNLWSERAVSLNLEFFTQVCNYNNGELSDPGTKAINTKDCSAGYGALICTSLAFVALIGVVCTLVALMINSCVFVSTKRSLPVARMDLKGKNFILYVVATVIAGFVGAYGAQAADDSFTVGNALMNKWLPIEPGQARTYFMIYLTAIVVALLYFIIGRINKKDNSQCLASFKEMNLGIGLKSIMKLLGLAILLFAACYTAAGAVNLFFEGRFMLIDGAFDLMKASAIGRMMRYFLVLFPACLVISTLNNMVTFKKVSDSADTALNVLFTSLGMLLLVSIAFIYTYSNKRNPDILHIQCILSIIPLVPITSYLYRKLYKLTGSPWLGAFFVTIILCWRCSGYVSHQFMWYGANELSAFWGIY